MPVSQTDIKTCRALLYLPTGLLEVRAVVDGQHYVKTGPLDLVVWEYMVYSRLQLDGNFPLICERLVDCGSGSQKAALLLHRVSTFSVLFKNHGTSLSYVKLSLVSNILPSLQSPKALLQSHTTLLRGVPNPWCA